MSEALEVRVMDLEVRLAFQEQALNDLSDALAATREEQATTARRLEAALGDLKTLRGLLYADPDREPPPPHY
jgi:SlyX protein